MPWSTTLKTWVHGFLDELSAQIASHPACRHIGVIGRCGSVSVEFSLPDKDDDACLNPGTPTDAVEYWQEILGYTSTKLLAVLEEDIGKYAAVFDRQWLSLALHSALPLGPNGERAAAWASAVRQGAIDLFIAAVPHRFFLQGSGLDGKATTPPGYDLIDAYNRARTLHGGFQVQSSAVKKPLQVGDGSTTDRVYALYLAMQKAKRALVDGLPQHWGWIEIYQPDWLDTTYTGTTGPVDGLGIRDMIAQVFPRDPSGVGTMATTRLALKRLIAKEFGYASGTCSAAGSTTTIVDTSADTPFQASDSDDLFDNAWAMIEADSAGTPLNVGEVRRIKAGGYVPSTGTITTDTAFSNATTTTQSYGIYMTVPPARLGLVKGIEEYLDELLVQLKYRTFSLLSQVTDADMETSGTGSWTASNATLTKSTASGVMLGKQALRVQCSSANGYARSALVSVAPGQTYELLADVTVSAGTAKLQLYDETNSTEIDSATTAVLRPGYLWLDSTEIPSGCNQVSVRLIGTTATSDVYWDNISLRSRLAKWIALPSWFVEPAWLEALFYVGGGSQEETNDSYTADERSWPHLRWWRVIADHGGVTPYRVEFRPQLPSGCHLFAKVVRPYETLSADTSSTDADQHWVRAWALARIYADRMDKEKAGRWLGEARALHRRWQPLVATRLQMDEEF